MTLASAKKVLFLPDIHVPYQDETALKIVCDFRKDFKPHRTVIMGDMMTADQVSSFKNDEETGLYEEYQLANGWLDKLTKEGDVFLEGNHEERLRRAGLVKPTLRKILSPERNLNLKKRGLRFLPYDNNPRKGTVRFGKLRALHGWWCTQYAARRHAEAYGCCVFAHTHRHQTFQPVHAYERNTGFNIGCLCRLDMPWQETSAPRGWTQGFAFAYIFKGGHFSLYDVRLIGKEFVINGKHYKR